MRESSLLILSLILNSLNANAQSVESKQADKSNIKMGIVFGLNQPLVTNGFNVEFNYYTKCFVFDYSHGFNLKIRDKLVSTEAKQQQIKFNISHSLGFGIGYRITDYFNIRIEPKMHLWSLYYNDSKYANKNIIAKYTTYTLGIGAYYNWMPFKNTSSFAKGLSVVPSFRWWPNINTTLLDNKFNYFNSRTGKNEVHKANNIGVSNTPFFGNISLGYSF
jgi:hypothetical protein